MSETQSSGAGELVEHGDPAADPRAFRRALGQFATGVAIMTASAGDRLVGMTANSFTSVSLDPPLVLWSLDLKAQSLEAFREASHFAINVLSADQVPLSTRFARSGPDKFVGVAWTPGRGGAPLLTGAAAHYECARAGEHQGGDHLVFFGHVEHFSRFDHEVLLYAHGRYGLAVDHPTVDVERRTLAASGDPHPLNDFLLPLLLRSYERLSNAFEHHREAESLTVNQSRILSALAAQPGASIEALSRISYVGLRASEEAISALLESGLVAMRPPGVLDVTASGRTRLTGIIERARAFEAEMLTKIPAGDVVALRRTLAVLADDGNSSGS